MDLIPFILIVVGISVLALPAMARYAEEFLSLGVAREARKAEPRYPWMQPAVSLIVLAASLFVILSGSYGESYAKWAFGSVGLILGYWLRPLR